MIVIRITPDASPPPFALPLCFLSLPLQGDVATVAQDMVHELGLTNEDRVAVPVSLQVSNLVPRPYSLDSQP